MVAKVVNCKKEDFDVFIGRPSKWGNKFSHLDGTLAEFKVESREEAIEKYEEWICSNPDMIEMAKKELKGKVLGCFCAPANRCHGDVLLKIANEE